MKKFILLLGISCLCFLLSGQEVPDIRQVIAADQEQAGGYFCHYPDPGLLPEPIRPPKGYKPFYISHFGRHGCRHHTAESIYRHSLEALRKAENADALTPAGVSLLEKMEVICADVRDRYGELTPRGREEHRGIAERMYAAYSEVFRKKQGRPVVIRAQSTVVPRCIMSMTAFNERLKELDPELQINSSCSRRDMRSLTGLPTAKEADVYSAVRTTVDSLRHLWVDPQRFISSLFSDPEFVRTEIHRPEVLMYEMYLVAAIQQDTDYLHLPLFSYFTDEELYALWKVLDLQGYCTMAPSSRFGRPILQGVTPLLEEIVTTADQVLSGELEVAATLRFGHDSGLIPLFSLMGLEDIALDLPLDVVPEQWNLSEISPMASNLQLIFFKNRKGQVKVRVLRNEKDALLPLEGGPFYDWPVLRAYLMSRLQAYVPAPAVQGE